MKTKKEMTTAELKTAAREYDATYNEGGEGYNPYRDELKRREREAASNRSKTKDDYLREIERLDCSAARENGTYDEAKINELRTTIDKLEEAEEALFYKEWTKEVTIARRAAWNAEAVKPGSTRFKISSTVGFTSYDLKKAVEHYEL